MFAGSQEIFVKLFTVPAAPLTVTLPELIVPFVPLIVTALAPSPAFTIPVVPLMLIALLPEPKVTLSFNATL